MRTILGGPNNFTFEPSYGPGGTVRLLVRTHEALAGGALARIVYSPDGFLTAPLDAPAERAYIGVIPSAVHRGSRIWVLVGGSFAPVHLPESLGAKEGDRLALRGGAISVLTEPSDYRAEDEFALIQGRLGEYLYRLFLYPVLGRYT